MRNAQCCKVRDARAAGSRPVSHSANEAGRVCKTKAACPSRLAVVRHLATKWERTWAYILASHGTRRVGLGPPDVSMGAAEARKQSSAQSVSEATACRAWSFDASSQDVPTELSSADGLVVVRSRFCAYRVQVPSTYSSVSQHRPCYARTCVPSTGPLS